jgi:hypothetical protein
MMGQIWKEGALYPLPRWEDTTAMSSVGCQRSQGQISVMSIHLFSYKEAFSPVNRARLARGSILFQKTKDFNILPFFPGRSSS